MPRPQVNSNGRMAFKNGRPNAGTSADPCCCEPDETIFWWSLWPCSAAFPVDNTECYPGTTDDTQCVWITQSQKDAIFAAAAAAGDYDPMGDPGVWPEHLVVTWAGTCWLIDGPSDDACVWNCNAVAPADEPPGTHATDAEYLGLSCGHAACDHDNDNEPDPPYEPPETENPPAVTDFCGCVGKERAVATWAGLAACDCTVMTLDGGGNPDDHAKASGNFNGTWDIIDLGFACTGGGPIPFILREYFHTPCDATPDSVVADSATATAGGGPGGWSAGIASGSTKIAFENAGLHGDCDGAIINNLADCAANGIASGGTCVITVS